MRTEFADARAAFDGLRRELEARIATVEGMYRDRPSRDEDVEAVRDQHTTTANASS